MPADRAHPDLAALAAAAEIVSPAEYRLLGESRTPVVPADFAGGDEARGALLRAAMELQVYARLYVRPRPGARTPTGTPALRDFVAALSAANGGAGSWEPGWRVVGVEADGRVAVSRDAVTFWTGAEGVRCAEGEPREGGFCRVRVAKELRHLLPGFYCAIGDGAEGGPDRTERLVRVYWNLPPGAAVAYIAAATELLNGARLPFRTKVLSDPGGYDRADAGVLYLERRHFAAARPALRALLRRFGSHLLPEVPLFSRRLAPGVGVAEDPGNGRSFGQARAATAVRGLWEAHQRGEQGRAARLQALVRAFREEGLDPRWPHLCAGSTDVYALASGPPRRMRAARLAGSVQ